MNTSHIGTEIAIIKDDPKNKNVKIFVSGDEDEHEHVKFFDKLELKNGKFQYIPDIKRTDRITNIYVVGANGSGKSFWIKDYVIYFIKITKNKYPIYLFSSKDEDEELDSIKEIKRVKIDNSFVSNPMRYEDLSSSLVIMDDIDAFRGKIKDEIYHLRDLILKNGRSYHINIICSSHDACGKENSTALCECEALIFFLKNYNAKMRYLLENYIGLDINQIKTLRKNKSRSTVYVKSYPNVILQEKNIYVMNSI